MACTTQTNTLDPLQNIIDTSEGQINTLEKQATAIAYYVESFRTQGTGFNPGDISDPSIVSTALESLTAEALCASETDIAPIDDLAEDCLNTALKGIRKYVNDILNNIADGLDAIAELIALPESGLFKLLQQIKALCDDIYDLIAGIDTKLQCVSLSEQAADYADQIAALNTRVDTVTSDLYLDDDGKFNSTKLTDGFDSYLQDNILSYETRADTVQTEIEETASSAASVSTINPKRYF